MVRYSKTILAVATSCNLFSRVVKYIKRIKQLAGKLRIKILNKLTRLFRLMSTSCRSTASARCNIHCDINN